MDTEWVLTVPQSAQWHEQTARSGSVGCRSMVTANAFPHFGQGSSVCNCMTGAFGPLQAPAQLPRKVYPHQPRVEPYVPYRTLRMKLGRGDRSGKSHLAALAGPGLIAA